MGWSLNCYSMTPRKWEKSFEKVKRYTNLCESKGRKIRNLVEFHYKI